MVHRDMPPADTTEELAGVEAHRIELDMCSLLLAAPAPSILATRANGMGSLELVERIIAFGDELLLVVPGIRIFHDFRDVTGYRAEARRRLVDWGVQKRDRILETHVLFRSKVVAMGVSIATTLLRDQLSGYSKPLEFEAARRLAIREALLAGPRG